MTPGSPALAPCAASRFRAAPGQPPVARVDGAVLSFGARRALDGASLAVRPGEVYVLLGPNGAGKSTLMRVLCGQLRLDAGLVAVDGRDPARDAGARAAIGFVPQEVALYPKLTVRENLLAFAGFAGSPRRARPALVAEAIARVRAGEVADRPVETLSGGNQRRANIAAALLGAPRLLVLDEPTVGVDIDARQAVHDVVLSLRREGVAVLAATHDFEQAEALADRVGFLVGGRLVREGEPAALVDDAFGEGAREVHLALAREPGEIEASALAQLGFRRREGDRAWSALKPSAEQALKVQDILRRSAIPVREARIRAPGLASLYRRIAGREDAPCS